MCDKILEPDRAGKLYHPLQHRAHHVLVNIDAERIGSEKDCKNEKLKNVIGSYFIPGWRWFCPL
jgi:hypothetical protein